MPDASCPLVGRALQPGTLEGQDSPVSPAYATWNQGQPGTATHTPPGSRQGEPLSKYKGRGREATTCRESPGQQWQPRFPRLKGPGFFRPIPCRPARGLLSLKHQVQLLRLHNQSASGTSLGIHKRTRQKRILDTPPSLYRWGNRGQAGGTTGPRHLSKSKPAHLRTDRSTSTTEM